MKYVVLGFMWGDEDPIDCWGVFDSCDLAEQYAEKQEKELIDMDSEEGWCQFAVMEVNSVDNNESRLGEYNEKSRFLFSSKSP